MNNLIINIPLISSPLEYFDRQTGGAWRLRSCFINMGVWAANAHLWALTTDDTQRICTTMQTLATIRTWLHEVVADGFALDLTAPAIRRTLGLDKELDPHEEAKRLARIKCIKVRSSTRFMEWYKDGFAALHEQRKRREESVEQIAELLAGTGFEVTEDVADHLQTFYAAPHNTNGYFTDTDLYDEATTERQLDQLSECLANVLVTANEVCDTEYAAAITETKVAKLQGYRQALRMGMEIVGIDTEKLQAKSQALNALLDVQEAKVDNDLRSLDEQIAAAMEQVSPAPATPNVTLVKSDARLAREAAALAAQTAAEEARQAKVAQAEKDLAARLEAERAKAEADQKLADGLTRIFWEMNPEEKAAAKPADVEAVKARAAAVRRQRNAERAAARKTKDLAEIKTLMVSEEARQAKVAQAEQAARLEAERAKAVDAVQAAVKARAVALRRQRNAERAENQTGQGSCRDQDSDSIVTARKDG